MEQAANLKQRTLRKGCAIVTPECAEYPELLLSIYSKPAALYVRGDLSCLEKISIGMVGTRTHSAYGREAALMLADGLGRSGVTVVSGLAKGIDTFCHEATLDAGGVTVGILGCGLDVDYPKGSLELKKRICQRGAVISEYPLGTPPLPAYFPMRNRVLSGICRGVVVVEADESSGSMITANHALEQGRDVFAVPGSIFSPRHRGTNRLIQDGARLVGDVEDILSEYGVTAVKKTSASMHNSHAVRTTIIEESADDVPQTVMEAPRSPAPDGISQDGGALLGLMERRPAGVEELMEKSGLSVPALQTALTELEI
jgi:DNA processing protein